eukprot:PhF_6_TR10531/c0_g1_i2/m.16577
MPTRTREEWMEVILQYFKAQCPHFANIPYIEHLMKKVENNPASHINNIEKDYELMWLLLQSKHGIDSTRRAQWYERLVKYFRYYDVRKAHPVQVDALLSSYEGTPGYDVMWSMLLGSFGPEPTESQVSSSPPAPTRNQQHTATVPAVTPTSDTTEVDARKETRDFWRKRLERYYLYHKGPFPVPPGLVESTLKMADTQGYSRMWESIKIKYGPEPSDADIKKAKTLPLRRLRVHEGTAPPPATAAELLASQQQQPKPKDDPIDRNRIPYVYDLLTDFYEFKPADRVEVKQPPLKFYGPMERPPPDPNVPKTREERLEAYWIDRFTKYFAYRHPPFAKEEYIKELFRRNNYDYTTLWKSTVQQYGPEPLSADEDARQSRLSVFWSSRIMRYYEYYEPELANKTHVSQMVVANRFDWNTMWKELVKKYGPEPIQTKSEERRYWERRMMKYFRIKCQRKANWEAVKQFIAEYEPWFEEMWIDATEKYGTLSDDVLKLIDMPETDTNGKDVLSALNLAEEQTRHVISGPTVKSFSSHKNRDGEIPMEDVQYVLTTQGYKPKERFPTRKETENTSNEYWTQELKKLYTNEKQALYDRVMARFQKHDPTKATHEYVINLFGFYTNMKVPLSDAYRAIEQYQDLLYGEEEADGIWYMKMWAERLLKYYTVRAPERANYEQVQEVLKRAEKVGFSKMWETLIAKYGPEPTPQEFTEALDEDEDALPATAHQQPNNHHHQATHGHVHLPGGDHVWSSTNEEKQTELMTQVGGVAKRTVIRPPQSSLETLYGNARVGVHSTLDVEAETEEAWATAQPNPPRTSVPYVPMKLPKPYPAHTHHHHNPLESEADPPRRLPPPSLPVPNMALASGPKHYNPSPSLLQEDDEKETDAVDLEAEKIEEALEELFANKEIPKEVPEFRIVRFEVQLRGLQGNTYQKAPTNRQESFLEAFAQSINRFLVLPPDSTRPLRGVSCLDASFEIEVPLQTHTVSDIVSKLFEATRAGHLLSGDTRLAADKFLNANPYSLFLQEIHIHSHGVVTLDNSKHGGKLVPQNHDERSGSGLGPSQMKSWAPRFPSPSRERQQQKPRGSSKLPPQSSIIDKDRAKDYGMISWFPTRRNLYAADVVTVAV